jgi:hypothetical protein
VNVTGHRDIVRRYDLITAGYHAGISGADPRAEQIRLTLIALLLAIDLDGDERGLDTREIAAKPETSQPMIEQHLAKHRWSATQC